jgi:hypothetical protein
VQVEGEAREPGQPTGVDGVDPGREGDAEAVGEDLAEVADMPGGGVQFGTAGEDVLRTKSYLKSNKCSNRGL